MTKPPQPSRKVLIAAYFYPPLNSIGARRPYALAKWLRSRGHDVTVLSSRNVGCGPDDTTDRVVRTRDLLATRLNWRRGNLEVITGQREGSWQPGLGLWGSLFVPDVQLVSWAPFAVESALRLYRRISFEVVITTSPVESAHLPGLALSRRGVPWIADLRDGWRFEAPRNEWPLRLQRRFDDAFERAVVRGADQVVTISEPLAADLHRRHQIAVETITNGFDPDDLDDDALLVGFATGAAPHPRKLTFVHTGGLGSERTLEPLLQALATMGHSDSDLSERVEIVLAGAQTEHERQMYARPEFAPFVRHLGFLERRQALALQHAANVLLLVTTGVRTGEATGKLFEYLAAQRPILVLGANSAAAEIVVKERAGIAVPVRDAAAAEAALRRILAGELPAPPPSARDAYAYPAIAERYEQVIERAIARRRGNPERGEVGAQRSEGGETRSADNAPAPSA